MKIHFGNQGNLRIFKNFAESLDFDEPEKLEITMNEGWVNVSPAQLALAVALARKVGRANAEIVGEMPKSARYLDRMGLFDYVKTPSPFGEYDHREPAGRFVPVQIIENQAEQSRFVADIIPLYHLDEKNSRIMTYIVGELIRNVLEHSYSGNGAVVVAQYYKESNRISFAICDTGIGLWKSMQIWRPRTDKKAMQLALTPGVSGTTLREGGTADNAGAGLFFIKSIAKISRGYFAIMSGAAEYTLLKSRPDVRVKLNADPFEDHYAFTDKMQRFEGTLVAVDLKLDKTEEFSNLLAQIGDVYEQAVKERKEKKFRGPNFIK